MEPKKYALLIKLASNPEYQPTEDEKKFYDEVKSEIAAAQNPEKDMSVEEAIQKSGQELAKVVLEAVKEMKESEEEITRSALQDDPKADPRVREYTKHFNENVEKHVSEKRYNDERAAEYRKAARFVEFTKALLNKDQVALSALAEGSDELGGHLVPDEFRAELIQHLLNTDAIRQYATVIPMEGKYLEIPKLTSDVQVTWGSENQAIGTTTAKFGNLTLTPFRMNAIIYTSRELFDDSAISIMQVLRRRFVDRMADEENKVFITGNGTTQPKGIDQETFKTISAGNSVSPDHITKAYWRLPRAYRRSSRWLINSRTIAEMEIQKDDNGAYLYESLQREVPTLKGRPILVDDYVPSSKIFLGDLSHYYIGDRQQVTMEVTTEGGNTWQQHQVGMKVIERIDGEVGLTEAFVEISNTGVS